MSSNYIHGSAPEEQARLARLNDLINDRCFAHVKLTSGQRVLDIGSGLGQFTNILALTVGSTGFCLAIERDEKQLTLAKQNFSLPNLVFRQGDANQLPLQVSEIGSFDFVHMRFLLEHLPNPAQALAQAWRALKPGGRILLFDDDHETMVLYPEPEGFKALWCAYMDSYVELGNDPFIGRKMPKLLREQGFKDVHNQVAFFGDCHGTPTFKLFVSNLAEVITTSREVIVKSNLLSETAFQTAINSIYSWAENPSASMWYTIAVAGGVK